MANKTTATTYQDNIYEAIEIITKKQLESLQFDRTIEATIISAKDAESGVYTVSTGEVSFLAYSSETGYKEKDVVMVTIPQGNYNNQKIIIGKKGSNQEDTPLVYQSPFSQIVDMTNNLVGDINYNDTFFSNGFRANGGINKNTTYDWNETEVDFLDSELFKQSRRIFIKENFENTTKKYTKIGIKADFSTFLSEYNTIYGNYGLAIVLSFANPDIDLDSHFITRTLILDSKNFFGNIYNFNNYTIQEGIYDISDLKDYILTRIEIYAYQRNNFKKNQEELIYPIGTSGSMNIFIKNIYICLGVDISEFNGDSLEIETNDNSYYYRDIRSYYEYIQTLILKTIAGELDSEIYTSNYIKYLLKKYESKLDQQKALNQLKLALQDLDDNEEISSATATFVSRIYDGANANCGNYSKQQKTLNISWIHQNENTNYIGKIENKNSFPSNKYHIYWYIYKSGASSPDQFVGAGWVRFYGCKDLPNEDGNYYFDQNKDLDISDDTTDHISNIIFYPNINRTKEQLKAVLIKESQQGQSYIYQKIAESEIITFYNQDEIPKDDYIPEYEQEIIDLNALSIRFNDNERGNYFLYNRAGNITAEENKRLRTLTAVFSPNESNIYKKPTLEAPYEYIKWSFPASNTMIQPVIDQTVINPKVCNIDMELIKIFENDNSVTISYNNQTDTFDFIANKPYNNFISIGYYIKKTLNHSAGRNNVFLTVIKEGQTYTAQVQMHFGPAGTSGSDYTITIEWDNNESVFDVGKTNKDSAYKISGQVYLYDQEGKLINPGKNYIYNLVSSESMDHLYSGTYPYKNDNWKIVETEDLYYPLIIRGEGGIVNGLDCMLYCDPEKPSPNFYDNGATNNIKMQYWIDCTWDNLSDFYTYDYNKNKFIQVIPKGNPDSNTIYYAKKSKVPNAQQPTKYKIKFQAFDEVKTNTTKNGYSGVVSKENIIDEQGNTQEKTIFYYNYGNHKKRRAFIKIGDTYIVDPASEYNPDFTYYYPIFESAADYKEGNNLGLKLTSTGVNNSIFSIQKNNDNLSMDSLYLLKISLQNFIGKGKNITATFPLALKQTLYNGSIQSFIEDGIDGPTEIRYSTFGVIDFDRNPYQLYIRERNQNGTYNSSLLHETDYAYTWFLKYPNKTTDNEKRFYPKLVETQLNSYDSSIKRPFLEPFGVYHQFSNVIGVQVKTKQKIVDNNAETILWTQPIYIYQDNYPSTTLNRWGGENIVQEDDTGIILAKGFGAGKKEDDNSFTGVVLGDWSKTDSDVALTKTTGVFGLNHGAVAYALMDDGTAFFGKEGSGRIYFDGNTAQIYSASWQDLVTEETDNEIVKLHNKKQGMMLDIDDGILDIENTILDYDPDYNPNYDVIAQLDIIKQLMDHTVTTHDTTYTLDYFIYHINEIYKKFQYEEIENCLIGLKAQKNLTTMSVTLVNSTIARIKENQYVIPDSEQDKYSTKSFSFLADSTQPLLSLNVEYLAPKRKFTVTGYQYDSANNIMIQDANGNYIMNEQTFWEERKIQHLNICSNSPFLSIGSDVERIATKDYEFNLYDNIIVSYNHDYIRINAHGGFLSSANFSPTISSWFNLPSTFTYNNKTYTNIYCHKENNNTITKIYPDNMSTSSYHAWGDTLKMPFTGLVVDLTHGNIVLGNDAEIKGYQTGKWGYADYNEILGDEEVTERVFHISNGARSTDKTLDGRYLSVSNSNKGPGYFILAETINVAWDQTAANHPMSHTPYSTDYNTIFRVDWDGQLICNKIYTEQINLHEENNQSSITLERTHFKLHIGAGDDDPVHPNWNGTSGHSYDYWFYPIKINNTWVWGLGFN